jgi:hypothetical protein
MRVKFSDEKNNGKFVKLSFKSEISLFNYNLGFKVKSCCYVFNKLATINIKKLESLLESELSEMLFTVILKKKKATFKLYDIFGNCVKKVTIKFTSINAF